MADQTLTQEDFGAGIVRTRRAPRNAVYDAVNALITDEGLLSRRAGSTFLSTAAGSTLKGLAAVNTVAGMRVIGLSDSSLHILADGATVPVTIPNGVAGVFASYSRPVGLGDMVAFRLGLNVLLYAGSLELAYTAGGTITLTQDSATLTGVGTTFLGNVDKGSIVFNNAGGDTAFSIVQSVESNTSLTLRAPWPGATTASAAITPTYSTATGDTNPTAICSAGTVPRLLYCVGARAYITLPGRYRDGISDTYVDIPDGGAIVGAEGVGGTAVLFTTTGVWALSGLDLDPVDDAGNQQWSMARLNKETVLWGDPGIVGWAGGLVVPAIDDIYVLSLTEAPVPVGGGIRPLYRDYVEAGYQPGTGAVHRGHYFLPVLNGSTVVDVLVCRLDRGSAWTRWANHAASAAFASQVATGTRLPKLLGISAQRITDLTGCFDPDAARDDDADGTDHQMTVETNDITLIGDQRKPGTAEKAELVYELAGTGATVAVSWAAGEDGAAFTALTAVRGGVESDGSDYSVWALGKARRAVRLRIVQSGAATVMILRRVALRVRGSGV